MPEPTTAPNELPGDIAAIAPTPPAPDKPTTHSSPEPSQAQSLLNSLDIPDEIKAKLAPKAETPPETPPTDPTPPSEPEVPPTQVEGIKDETDDDEDEVVALEQKQASGQELTKTERKLLKRIGRLTRRNSEFETQLDVYSKELQSLRPKQEQQQQIDPVSVAVSGPTPWMPDQETAQSYQKITFDLDQAEAVTKWCDANEEGVTIINQQGQEEFIEPTRVKEWRRAARQPIPKLEAEKAVIEREAKRAFKILRMEADQAATKLLPQIFDPKTEEYQMAQQILRDNPALRLSPRASYDIGVYIEGMKALQAKSKNGNGATPRKGDINPIVFTAPRAPIAPSTPEPPSREKNVSSKQKANEAMTAHIKDPDGNHLVDYFTALDEEKRGAVNTRSLVRS